MTNLDTPRRYWLPAYAAAPDFHASAPAAVATTATAAGFPIEAVRADFPALERPTRSGDPEVWLDNAATTHKPRQVIDAVRRFYALQNSNIHRGAHAAARQATDLYESARQNVADFLGAASREEVVFTRGTTEAINLVAHAFGGDLLGPGDEVIATTLEHHSNIVPWQIVCRQRGARLREAPVDDAGQIDLAAYTRLLSSRTKIVALTHVSNVLGTVPPVRVMADLAHRAGAVVVVDGAQAVAHVPVNVAALGADFYAFSGHKIFAPTGIGALWGRRDLLEAMPPWQTGGGMIEEVSFAHTRYAPVPARFEAGTPHIAGAVGLSSALDYLNSIGPQAAQAHEAAVHAYARSALETTVPGLRLLGCPDPQISVLTFTIDGIDDARIAAHLDDTGIMVRSGHHCAQPALARFGLKSALRPSLAVYNTYDEIDRLVHALTALTRSRR